MSRRKSLLWKEWHEIRILLAIGVFVFVGLPAIGALEDRTHRFGASLWVLLLGGLLGTLVGVGTVAQDLNGRLENFWRSRPVGVVRWLAVKYFMGLGVVLATLTIPLIIEIVLTRGSSFAGDDPRLILAWSPFVWTAGYSIAFAAACLIRRPAHAAIISIAALLLLYFLPYVLPPIQFMELSWVMDASEFPRVSGYTGRVLSIYHRIPWMPWRVLYEPRQLLFALGMLVVAVAGLALAATAVKLDWHIEAGRKLIYWSIGSVVLVVLSSAAFQVGSNLPLLQKLDLPENNGVVSVQSDGSRGVMLTWTDDVGLRCQSLRVTTTALELGPSLPWENNRYMNVQGAVWLAEHPGLLYVPGDNRINSDDMETCPTLTVVNLQGAMAQVETESFPDDVSNGDYSRLFSWNGRLYLLGHHCRTFDLSDPFKPRLVSTEQIKWAPLPLRRDDLRFLIDRGTGFETGTVSFPDIAGLAPRQRLETVLGPKAGYPYERFSGDILTRVDAGDRLTTCHLEQLTDHSATFRRLGVYEPTSLERFYGSAGQQFAQLNGLFYESLRPSPPYNDNARHQLDGAHLTVFGVDGPRPRPIGHFAAPDERTFQCLCPLPDGRLLVAGEHRLYLLGPPLRR